MPSQADPQITFHPQGAAVPLRPGRSILEHALEANIGLRAECGGRGKCGKCLVQLESREDFTEPGEDEKDALGPEALEAGLRLACRAVPLRGARVVVPAESLDTGATGYKSGIYGPYDVNPMVRRYHSPAPESGPDTGDAADDVARALMRRAVDAPGDMSMDLAAMRQVEFEGVLKKDWTLTVRDEKRITAVWPGHANRSLGLAVDLGTTTVAAYLCDMATGLVEATASMANPQRPHGEDVISRILYTRTEAGGLITLQGLAIGAIAGLLSECLAKVRATRDDVDEIVVCGNTTMEHILLGVSPAMLGLAPFRPVFRFVDGLGAADLGPDLAEKAGLYVFPAISGFVGGDTTAAVLAARPPKAEEVFLVVDMGTNGELVLGTPEGYWAASCATGPALEGSQLSCGMRAGHGAIDTVTANLEQGRAEFHVISPLGRAKPAGICGSGVLDAVAAMRELSILDESGHMDESLAGRAFTLAPAEDSAAGRPITVTQKDVRRIQLAKAALQVGIQFLLQAAGVNQVDRLVLTGAFGARFNWKSGAAIGMLPESVIKGTIETPPNAAGEGAVMALLDRDRREEAERLAGVIETVELARQPNFNQAFVEAMALTRS